MAESEGFQARLEAAVGEKRAHLEETSLPRLKESFRMFQSHFENLYNILLRKALVQEDPYKYEQKVSEVTVPPKGDILDMEKTEQLSRRLSCFHAQLEFLNTYCQFSTEFLNLPRIRRIIGLLQYIDWRHLTETSADPTTAVLAETLGKIRPGSDNVSTGIVSSSLNQMRTLSASILVHLKEILAFQKQNYKLTLRRRLSPFLDQAVGRLYAASPDKAYERVRAVFASSMKGKPLYRDLVTELLQEEYAEQSETLRERCLAALEIVQHEPVEAPKKPDDKIILIEAARLMFPAGGHLRDALGKIVNNQGLVEKSRQGLGGRLRSWLHKAFQNRELETTVETRYFDTRTSTLQTDSFDFQKFVERVRRKSSLFSALSQPDSVAFARLIQASEQQIDEFLEKNLAELQLFHRRLRGLNEYFRQTAPQDPKDQLKGIKIELSGLKNCIIRANRRRYEYAASKEEQLRLRQLGV
jgi:hypothetical protein